MHTDRTDITSCVGFVSTINTLLGIYIMKKDLKIARKSNNQSLGKCNDNLNEKKAISFIQLNYAETQIELTNLNEEEKKQKLNNAHQVVEVLSNSLRAKGLLQNMLVTQLLGVHEAQQKLISYVNRSMHSSEHGQYYINALTKLSNVFIQQINALQKLQGYSQQKVVVEHLHVNAGGKAIVGQVNTEQMGGINEK